MNSLKLNPNAKITGKMFGQGIYFAPDPDKSWNYTSYHGSYYAKGTSDIAFMGLYATAYGIPHDVNAAGFFTKGILDSKNKNCIHAHAGENLYRDEIVFYDENAILLQYIVEFN